MIVHAKQAQIQNSQVMNFFLRIDTNLQSFDLKTAIKPVKLVIIFNRLKLKSDEPWFFGVLSIYPSKPKHYNAYPIEP